MRSLCLLACACMHATPAPSAIPLATARAYFAEAQALCTADAGRAWGRSLCGPIMLVDPDTHAIVASRGAAPLHERDGVFVGTLPAATTVANTSTTWAGVAWIQLRWPLPEDRAQRAVLLMHESFHRIAPTLGIAGADGCAHLDGTEARIALQLEWRALAAALRATGEAERAAIRDALALRAARQRDLGEARCEDALELHEGLAEYTGVVVGGGGERLAAALRDLADGPQAPSFVRSFAYASGPALGLLLDRHPAWRHPPLRPLAAQLRSLVDGPLPDVAAAAARYDGAALRAAEQTRAEVRAAQLAQYRARLVDGPVAILPLHHMQIAFDPRTVVVLAGQGTVYPTLRIIDDWGVLDVTGGALVRADGSAAVVPAPDEPGHGWTLQRAPGWRFEPAARAGDVQLRR